MIFIVKSLVKFISISFVILIKVVLLQKILENAFYLKIVMKNYRISLKFFFCVTAILLSLTTFAGHGNSEDKEFSPTDLINDHIGDSHDFHIADWNGHPISFSLPIILWSDKGLEIFSSKIF